MVSKESQFPSEFQAMERQYQIQFDTLAAKGPVRLGPTASYRWRSDPRLMLFFMSRYKFCAKMLSGRSSVLEIGCGDGFGIGIMLQEVRRVHAIDFDPVFIDCGRKLASSEGWNCSFSVLDITKDNPEGQFDAAYALDVIEHIREDREKASMEHICKALTPHGILILGTPNVTASQYASTRSREGHVNLKSADSLRELLADHFHNVFLFSMNDEVVHTGYYPMAHYLFGMGVSLK